MESGAFRARLVIEVRRFVSEWMAPGRLQHDHVRAMVGEQSGGEGAGHPPGQVDDDEVL